MILKLTPMKKFLLLYGVYILALFILIEQSYFQSLLNINGYFSQIVTTISANIMMLFTTVTYEGNYIHLSNGSLEVLFGCNGLESIILYIAAIFAYPATHKEKVYGLLIGFVLINVINIIRIVILGYVHLYHHNILGVMHDYITQKWDSQLAPPH
ncbi:MAG: archaeosortase/exosortase family protein [Campylobacterales bacterium]|nr:archaeosortase/exosortase family protein [Campylobacterales bacterium]